MCPSSTAQPYQSLLQVDQFQAHSISASVYTLPLKSSIEFGQVKLIQMAYMALNDIDAAVESFKKALELEPNDAGIKKELAAAEKKTRSAEKSIF